MDLRYSGCGPNMENRPCEWRSEFARQSTRCLALPAAAGRTRANAPGLPRQPRGIAGDQLDQVGLAASAGLFEQAAEVGLDRGLGDAEAFGHLAHAALL